MRKIVKEPFAPKRRHVDNCESRVGWWRALCAVLSLIFLKGNPSAKQMAKYLQRSCPRCHGYVGIVLREPGRNTSLQTVNGHCLGCGYRLAWIVIRGKRDSARGLERERRLSKWK